MAAEFVAAERAILVAIDRDAYREEINTGSDLSRLPFPDLALEELEAWRHVAVSSGRLLESSLGGIIRPSSVRYAPSNAFVAAAEDWFDVLFPVICERMDHQRALTRLLSRQDGIRSLLVDRPRSPDEDLVSLALEQLLIEREVRLEAPRVLGILQWQAIENSAAFDRIVREAVFLVERQSPSDRDTNLAEDRELVSNTVARTSRASADDAVASAQPKQRLSGPDSVLLRIGQVAIAGAIIAASARAIEWVVRWLF